VNSCNLCINKFYTVKVIGTILIIVALVYCSNTSYAQLEARYWYFGFAKGQGLRFDSNQVVKITDGSMKAGYGCGTISDKNGNLLFYTDGERIWNRNHDTMKNGGVIKGFSGAMQGAIIIPLPGNPYLYYVFTVSSVPHYNGGFWYHIVDMKGDNGKGEVILKDQHIYSGLLTKKMAATFHANKKSVWIMIHEWNSNRFRAYQLTSNGLDTNSVISSVGTVHQGVTDNQTGEMKFTPSGNKLACAISKDKIIEIFNFDNKTGRLSNCISLDCSFFGYKLQGLEFSPNEIFLYANGTLWGGGVYQIDMSSGIDSVISQSLCRIDNSNSNIWFTGFQIGLDKRIYIATYNGVLARINNPDVKGKACNYQDTVFTFSSFINCLPTFLQSYFYLPDIEIENTCFGDSTSFTMRETSKIDSVLWDFGDSSYAWTNFTQSKFGKHVYADTGVYKVTAYVLHDYLTDTLEREFRISNYAFADFTIQDNSQCLLGNEFHFYDTSYAVDGSMTYEWDFGDSNKFFLHNPVKSYDKADTFPVCFTLTSSYGCETSVTKNVYVRPMPFAEIAVNDSSQCLNTNSFVLFNPMDTINPVGSKTWFFGDGSSSNSDTALYSYSYYDTFQLTLIEETSFGCKDTARKNVYVLESPIADFIINDSSQCLNENKFHFINLTAFPNLSGLVYNWNFGDNTFSSDSNTSKTFSTFDTFEVQLLAISSNVCKDSVTKQVLVLESPKAEIGINDSSQCLKGNHFEFFNLIVPKQLDSFIYKWDFGDNTNSQDSSPVKIYQKADTFQLSLILTNSFGCKDTAYNEAYVHPMPLAAFSINDTSQCENENHFRCTDTTQFSYSKLKRSWELSDKSTYTAESITHTFNSSNIFSIKLKLESEEGCLDSLIKQIIVFPSPTTSFDINDTSQCFNENKFDFINKSTISSGSFSSQIWDMGNREIMTGFNVVGYVYQIPDTTLYVKLKTVSDQGCTHSDSSKIYIHPVPKAAFTTDNPSQCLIGNNFNFSNISIISSGRLNYRWFLNDSLLGSSQQFNNLTIQQYGNYLIKLKATSEYLCHDSVQQKIFVNPMPKARFTNSMPCLNNPVDFTNQSNIPVGNIIVYQWYFDLVKNSTQENTSYLFTSSGYHEAKLLVESDSGCRDSSRKNIYLYDHVDANKLERATVTENDQILVEWSGSSMGNPMSYKLERSIDSISFYELAVFDTKSLEYLDESVKVQANSYIYRIQTIDSCGYGSPYSNIGKSILLKADESSEYTKLSWTAYQYWEEDVNEYEVQIFNKSLNDFVDLYSSKETIEFEDNITDLNQPEFCYRIKAIRNGDGLESFSNTVCVSTMLNVFVPNAFSPNSDGLNDEFEIKGTFIIDYKIMIYDRWGQLLFESDDIEKSWDGKFNNSLCPVGDYYYQVQVKGTSGNRDFINGTVSIIR